PEEWGDLPDAPVDRAVDHDPALVGEIVREEELDLAEPHRERDLPDERRKRDAAGAAVGRVLVLVARGVVELLRLRPDQDVVVRHLTVVDLRARDLREPAGGPGRDVLDPKLG